MVVVDIDEVLDLDDLPDELAPTEGEPRRRPGPVPMGFINWSASRWRRSRRMFIEETLRITAGNREEAATMLGIGERTLYRKIKEYGLS